MIVTFFSWKGGVGRTMALANAGIELARLGASTLMVDWDLEAPGLHRYFFSPETAAVPGAAIEPAQDPSGLMGLLADSAPGSAPDPVQWQRRCASIIVPAAADHGKAGPAPATLHLLASGHGSDGYAAQLEGFSWTTFFRDGGGIWLEALRGQWSSAYDAVLIDSRTGLTDSGGVCTVQMPDIMVLVFTANDQSLTDGLRFVDAVQRARADFAFERSALAVVPLLSRWEGKEEVDLGNQWLARMAPLLEPLASPWLPAGIAMRRFLERFRVPHVARFSFGEPLPVLTHSVTDPDLPGLPYSLLATLLRSSLAEAGTLTDPAYKPPFNPDTADDRALSVLAAADADVAAAIETAERRHGQVTLETQRFIARMADAAKRIGRIRYAETLLRQAYTLNSRLIERDPAIAVSLLDRSTLLRRLGNARIAQGDLVSAVIFYEAAADAAARYGAATPNDEHANAEIAACRIEIGDIKRAQGSMDGALAEYRAGLAISERLAAADPRNAQWQRDLSLSHDRIGDVKRVQGDLDGALSDYRAGLTIRERLAAADPGNAQWQRDLSVSHNKIGDVKWAQGDLDGALAGYRAGLSIRERLAAADPGNAQWQRDLSVSHNKIGDVKGAQGDLDGALSDYRAGLAIGERLAAADPGNAQWQRDLSISHERIGDVKQAQGDLDGALSEYLAGLAILESLAKSSPSDARVKNDLAWFRQRIAAIRASQTSDR